MFQKDEFRLLLLVFILASFIFVSPAFAEIKVFEKETTWKAAKNQSQEQAPNVKGENYRGVDTQIGGCRRRMNWRGCMMQIKLVSLSVEIMFI